MDKKSKNMIRSRRFKTGPQKMTKEMADEIAIDTFHDRTADASFDYKQALEKQKSAKLLQDKAGKGSRKGVKAQKTINKTKADIEKAKKKFRKASKQQRKDSSLVTSYGEDAPTARSFATKRQEKYLTPDEKAAAGIYKSKAKGGSVQRKAYANGGSVRAARY
tara:strand:- start:1017 stop:1505 length:489 start_codon:yes stop_codon:yes gene_type:complete